MATIITRDPVMEPIEVPEVDGLDYNDLLGVRVGKATRIDLLKYARVDTQFGTIWLGTWGVLSTLAFAAGFGVLIWSGFDQVQGNMGDFIKYFANLQTLPPDGLGAAPSLRGGGYWQIIMLLWGLSTVFWAGRCYERLIRHKWRPYLLFAYLSAMLLTATIWVFRPLVLGTWAEAPALGLNGDLDWAQNFSVLWGNLYYNPWHQLAIFFLLGSTMLWGMHGATILATANEGSHHEDAEIKDMHSGSHKSMLFWRWTMGFNANPKTIHDWIWWFSVGTVVASAIGIISTTTVTNDWYVWAVDHGTVAQYGELTRDAINERPAPYRFSVPDNSSMPAPK